MEGRKGTWTIERRNGGNLMVRKFCFSYDGEDENFLVPSIVFRYIVEVNFVRTLQTIIRPTVHFCL